METYKVIFKEGETTGVYGISLVNDPAMESMFIALKKDEMVQLKTVNQEKRIVCGAVLVPNKPIYRNQNGKEFNIIFPENTIRLASEEFFRKGYQNSSTIEHDVEMELSNVTIVESWIKEDNQKDKSLIHGFDEPVGTWFATMKIDNPDVWDNYVKTGKVKGFSIDGFFDLEKVNLKTELNMSDESKKSLFDEIKQIIKDTLALKKDEVKVELGSIKSEDGTLEVFFDGEMASLGGDVYIKTPDGQTVPLPDGEYKMENGMGWVISNGKVAEFKEAEAPTEDPNPQTPMTNGTPAVKSEKVTQEVIYQLSKTELIELFKNVSAEIETAKTELRAEFTTALKKEEVIELTKNKPARENTEPENSFQKFRKHNKKFK